jgi:hypothetical protein
MGDGGGSDAVNPTVMPIREWRIIVAHATLPG